MSLSKTVSGWADEIRKMQGGGSSKAKALGKAKMAKTNPRKAKASMPKGKEINYLFESPNQTIKRIKNDSDSRYED